MESVDYLLLADMVTVIHTALIVGILLGILVSVRYKRFRPIEALFLLLAILIWSLYSGCPLTYLEDFLRTSAGHSTALSQAGFIPFYFNKWFGFFVTNREITIATYITAAFFFVISMEWMGPYAHLEIVKIRRAFVRSKVD